MQKIKKFVHENKVNFLVLIISTIICLFILELFFKIAYPQELNPDTLPISDRGKLAEYDPLLGWKYKQNFSSVFKGNLVHLNNYGLRMASDTKLKKEKFRIALVGDSFIWGHNVKESERFGDLLDKKFNNIEVLNFGVSGYGTDQYLLAIKNFVLNFSPDIIVLGIYANDFVNSGNREQYGYNKPLFVIEYDKLKITNVPVPDISKDENLGIVSIIDGIFSHYSHTYVFLQPYLLNIYFKITKKNNENSYAIAILKKEYSLEYENYKVLNEKILCNISYLLKQRNITLIVINIPSELNLNRKKLENKLIKLNLNIEDYDVEKQSVVFRDYSKKCEFKLIDLYPHFVNRDDLYEGHWTSEGEQLIAAILERFLIKEDLI